MCPVELVAEHYAPDAIAWGFVVALFPPLWRQGRQESPCFAEWQSGFTINEQKTLYMRTAPSESQTRFDWSGEKIMIGGLKKTTSRLALVAAAGFIMGGMALTPANAADLGGDCCADLEERVAELEATTVRKGNRKVSQTISGHVARVIGWYEDEHDGSEFYSAGHGVSGSRVQFAGSAELVRGWTAGYTLRMRFSEDRSSDDLYRAGGNDSDNYINDTKNLADTHDKNGGVEYDRNFVYLKHNRIGTFVAGLAGAPTDGIADISLAGRGVTGDAAGTDWNGSGIQGFDLEQGEHQAIAYISPTIAGFTLAVAWADLDVSTNVDGGDLDSGTDAFDVALRYAREFGPIRLAAGIGYTWLDSDEIENVVAGAGDASNVMGSVALMHVPTGLNIAFGAGTGVDGTITSGNYYAGVTPNERDFWHVEGGVNRDFTGLGNTSIYGEYGVYDYDDGYDDVTMWGLGVVQNFDKAATELFIAYRQWESDVYRSSGTYAGVSDGEVSQIMAGMRIKF
jgi:hypothetical protein